jgi:putative membrane protein
MATIQRPTSFTTLWLLTAVVVLGMIATPFIPGLRLPIIVLQVVFALLHGAQRYGWRAIAVFAVVCLVISNIMENTSILTGFPFGHYHYTGGGKIFLVPWFIGPAYLGTGYLAWVVASTLLGDVRRSTSWLITIGTPMIGAFVMTAWDLSMDPTNSTINHAWIWENGGGFFGVPLLNFLGWTLTVYLFMQVFALYLRGRNTHSSNQSAASDVQGVLLYGALAISYFVPYFTGERKTVADAAGQTWHTGDIYETSALTIVYGMLFFTILALLRLAHQRTAAPSSAFRTEPTSRVAAEQATP